MGWKGKVVSGAQTGVDRAALDAALEAGLACGGWVPKGRLAEDGTVPGRYPVQECDSADYAVRTAMNVRDADATLVLYRGELEGGTLRTLQACWEQDKPCLALDLDEAGGASEALDQARAFLDEEKPKTLNVAGPRASKDPGIYALARRLLDALFR